MLKGWKTIIFNALMLIVGISGAEVNPDLVREFAEEFIAVLTIGNGILRAVTSSPIFNRNAKAAGRVVKGLAIAALCFLVVGCTAATDWLDENTGTTLAQRCGDYRLAVGTLTALRADRDLTAAEANRLTLYEIFIESKCPALPAGP